MIAHLLLAAMLVEPVAATEAPALRRTAEGAFVVDSAEPAPARRYAIRFDPPRPGGMTVAEQLERILPFEPYEIVTADDAAGTALVETTLWGGFTLTLNNHHWSAIRVAEVTPPVERIDSRSCSDVLATLVLSGPGASRVEEVRADELCPAADELLPREHLLVQGLDASGRQLWLARADDPRFYRFEDLSEGGRRETGQHDEPELTTDFHAPVTPDLAALRWYEVTPDGALRRIGEMPWSSPAGDR